MRRKKGKKRQPPPPPPPAAAAVHHQNWEDDEEESDFDDDDDDDESTQYAPLLGGGISLETENKWDNFENSPIEDVTRTLENPKFYQSILIVLKILTYGVVFVVVVGGAVMAKMAFLMMTSQIHPDTKRPLCFYDQRRQKQVEITLPERVQWTWALFLCFAFPEIFTLIRSLRISIFKRRPRPHILHFLVPCFFEVCHVIGLSLLTFCVLPSQNAIKGAMMTNAVCLLPAILALLSRHQFKNLRSRTLAILDMLAITGQLLVLIFWPMATSPSSSNDRHPDQNYWLFPLSAILTSFGWWESYVSTNSAFAVIRRLAKMRDHFEKSRYPAHIYISLIKMAIFFATMCLSIVVMGDDPKDYFDLFQSAVTKSNILHVTEVNDPLTNGLTNPDLPNSIIISQKILNIPSSSWAVYEVVTTQVLASFLCYAFAKFACRICIQRFSFALPLTLSVPVTLTALIWLCGARDQNPCYASPIFPDYLYWTCPRGSDFARDFLKNDYGWIWFILLLSQAWITLHAWFPNNALLANTEVIFCTPMYNALLTDQNLLMNRKRDQNDAPRRKKVDDGGGHGNQNDEEGVNSPQIDLDVVERARINDERQKDATSHIIACATMWHEEKEEMVAMLKSVFRMDCDHWTQKQFVKEFGHRHRDYFEYDTHIFFDDAFERKNKQKKASSPYMINDYVKNMLAAIFEACQRVHLGRIVMTSPTKFPAPYGGVLVYTLPGGTRLTIHLKNKDKIRHRKRWSQVMYMYYLLKHKLRDQNLPPKREKMIGQNTYLLALDGDIDFQPHAVKLLVDRMKRNGKLGAACGRIHPTGAGPMVWYQKFEYAIGHWLQKATEHMIGCVLCSPGCFSLFRARALMSDRVMRKYTTMSEKPRDYVQYDQGEDRWLCTLLLQQGYRVEYCAASDAFTNAPKGFDEFYNQRRRWVPSTMANILDLLADYKRTVQKNQDISTLYIIYQFVLMGGSILGPGTIFLMLVGAFVAAFRIDNFTSFCINFAPLILFILVCYFCQEKSQKWKQLALAKLLSAIYALVMVAVLIAILLQVLEDGLLAPSSIFMVAITLSFIIAAIVHPLEFSCLPHGVIYYVTIPSMYLLLIIYSLFNLNDVTWGTRDNPTNHKEDDDEGGEEISEKNTGDHHNKDSSFLSNVFPGFGGGSVAGSPDMESSFGIDCGALCRFSCCLAPKKWTQGGQKIVNESAKSFRTGGGSIPSSISTPIVTPQQQNGGFSRRGSSRPFLPAGGGIEEEEYFSLEKTEEEKETDRNPLLNPYWLEDPVLRRAPTDFLPTVEIKFWKKLIQQYLKPIEEDKKAKKDLEAQLLQLRNYTVGAFLMFNAVFVTAMFLLQMNKDQLFFEWPIGATHNMTFVAPHTVTVQTTKLHLEPLGLLFVGFYAVVLVIQFIAMIFHRLGTFSHIMASTSIFKFCGPKIGQLTSTNVEDEEEHAETNRFDVIRALAMKITASEEAETDTATEDGGRSTASPTPPQRRRRTTSENLPVFSLDQQYEKSFKKLAKSPEKLKRMSKFVPNLETTMGEIQATREIGHGIANAAGSRRPSENFLTLGRRRTLAGTEGKRTMAVAFEGLNTTSF